MVDLLLLHTVAANGHLFKAQAALFWKILLGEEFTCKILVDFKVPDDDADAAASKLFVPKNELDV
jgi:hypothetical protein